MTSCRKFDDYIQKLGKLKVNGSNFQVGFSSVPSLASVTSSEVREKLIRFRSVQQSLDKNKCKLEVETIYIKARGVKQDLTASRLTFLGPQLGAFLPQAIIDEKIHPTSIRKF